jgi:hypothetical protein
VLQNVARHLILPPAPPPRPSATDGKTTPAAILANITIWKEAVLPRNKNLHCVFHRSWKMGENEAFHPSHKHQSTLQGLTLLVVQYLLRPQSPRKREASHPLHPPLELNFEPPELDLDELSKKQREGERENKWKKKPPLIPTKQQVLKLFELQDRRNCGRIPFLGVNPPYVHAPVKEG